MRLVLRKFQLPIEDAKWLDAEAVRVQRPVASILRDAVKALRLGRTPAASPAQILEPTCYEAHLAAHPPDLRDAMLAGNWDVEDPGPTEDA